MGMQELCPESGAKQGRREVPGGAAAHNCDQTCIASCDACAYLLAASLAVGGNLTQSGAAVNMRVDSTRRPVGSDTGISKILKTLLCMS